MIKLFWYLYFVVYLMIISLNRIKVAYLRRVDPNAADEYAYKQVQRISKHVLKKSKTKFNVIGKENIPDAPCVFVGNHQAIFDAFAIMAVVDNITGFIAKKEIRKIPLISGWLNENHVVYIDRSNIKEGIKAINDGVECLKSGYSMVIFPEGTRSLGGPMKEFKKGSLKLALKSKAPIVPVSVEGTYKVLEVGNQVRGNEVTIIFHKPILVDSLSKEETKDITDIVCNIVKKGLESIKSEKVGE